MIDPSIVAYSICRRCAAVFPAERRCPTCDGDTHAAEVIAAATATAVEPLRTRLARPPRRRLMAPVVAVSAVMLALGVGLGWAVAGQRHTQALGQPVTTSATDEAAR